jgi:TRAP-type C4-dicarboxylate transport system permease small subunit
MTSIARKARSLEAGIRIIENVINAIGMVILLGMMFLGAADVISRYIFNRPILGAVEISDLMMGMVVFFGWGYTMAIEAHITVDVLFLHYPPRAKAILNFVMYLLTLVLFAFIGWKTGAIAVADWHAGKEVNVIDIPIAPFKFLISFGAIFLGLECIIHMIHLVPKMRRR